MLAPILSIDTSIKRLMFFGALGMVLFNFPLLFLPSGTLWGFPILGLYLFGVWALLIIGAIFTVYLSSPDINHIESLRAKQTPNELTRYSEAE